MEDDQELTETTDSNIRFLVPDSQLDDENSQQVWDLVTGLPALKSQHIVTGENSILVAHSNISSGPDMSERKAQTCFHFSSTNESEVEEQGLPLAVDTVSDNSESSRYETDRNTTVIEKVIRNTTVIEKVIIGSDKKHREDKSFVSTPSEKIGSLRFSAEPMNVPETVDSYDEVAPTPEAFESVPMIIPDSPCIDDKDEEDDEITFRPVCPTVDPGQHLTTQISFEQNESRGESQSLHLKLTPSQADVLETSDVEEVTAENVVTEKTSTTGTSPLKLGQNQNPVSEATKSLPIFCFQKPTLAAREMENVEESEESMSVFRRVRSGNTTPQKHKLILDDSDEFLPEAGVSSLTTKNDLRSQRKQAEKHAVPVSSKTLSSKKSRGKFLDKSDDLYNVGEHSVSQMQFGSATESGLILIDSEKVHAHNEEASVREHKTSWKEKYGTSVGHAAQVGMKITEDTNSQHIDEDLTLSYECTTGEKSLSISRDQSVDVAVVSSPTNIEVEKQEVSHNPQVHGKQSSSVHVDEEFQSFCKTAEQAVVSRKETSTATLPEQTFAQGKSLSKKDSSKAVHSHSETAMQTTPKMSTSSLKCEKRLCTSQEPENSNHNDSFHSTDRRKKSDADNSKEDTGRDLHESTFLPHTGGNSELPAVVGRTSNTPVPSRDTSTSFSVGVLHSDTTNQGQTKSVDSYTIHGSQSQTIEGASHMPLSEKGHVTVPQGRRQSVKFLKKVLRKRIHPKLEEGKSSSTDDTSKSNQNCKPPEIRGQNLRKKQKQKSEKAEQTILCQGQEQQTEQQQQQNPELVVTEHTEFTSLQKKTQFNKPFDPPTAKAGPSSHKELADVHADKTQRLNEEEPTKTGDSVMQTKKSATVNFSDVAHGETSEVSRNLSDSSEHEVERTTVQRIVTIIVTERTKIEVYNSKGKVTRQTENIAEVERINLDKVKSEKITERIITPQLSPSRSASTMTTGDLADVSSSSLSRVYSSGSKTNNPSIDTASSSQSLPTPAQRQHSLEGQDKERLQQEGENRHNSDKPGAIEGTIFLSKVDQKRLSASSNTGHDLFSTPNQSVIDRADSQIGKVISSSNSTPGSPSLISPNTAINKPDHNGKVKTISLQKTRDKGTLTCDVATSTELPADAIMRTAVSTSVSEQPKQTCDNAWDTRIHEQAAPQDKGIYAQMHSETPQRQEPSESIRGKRLMKSDDNSNDDNSDEEVTIESLSSKFQSKKRKTSNRDTSSLKPDQQKKRTARKATVEKSKEDIGESADVQSTGFSVHGVPPTTASGDSLKDPALTVSSKSSAGFSYSSEVSLQGGTVKSHTQMVVLKGYKSKAETGAKVMGKWKDGYYYPGILSKVDQSNKKYMVKFDDGSQRLVKVNEIILAGELPVGQSVMVLTSNDFYEPGMVMGHSESWSDEGAVNLVYHVERDDGVTQMCERKSLILSEGQAACLLSDEEMRISPDACTPLASKPADISLDNLVDGKRHPKSARALLNKEDQPSTSGLQSTSAAASVSTAENEACHSGRKRKMGPVATSTPTPKQVCKEGRKKGTPVKKSIPSPLGGVVASPSESRKVPRKACTGLSFESVTPNKSKLFEGMLFMLTHVEKSADDRAQEKMLLEVSSLETSADDNTDAESEISPFVKKHLQAIIEAGGGQVINSFDEAVVQSAKQCYLVAAEHQRTVKYLQALAAGLTIVSHQWILHSAAQNQLQGLKAYILPAGISLEKKKLVEGTKGCSVLARQTVMIVSANHEFVDVWTSILNLAHSHVVTRFPSRASKNDPGVDQVVSDSTCSASIVKRCQQLDVPLVSSEWVAQCLITGHLVDVRGHEKYRHDFAL